MKILSVQKAELAWQANPSVNPGKQANDRIQRIVGKEDSKCFAEMFVEASGYAWTADAFGWTPLSQATASQKQRANEAVNVLFDRVRKRNEASKDGRLLADRLLSLPDDRDKYIHFKEDVDGFRVLVAGWGFRNNRDNRFHRLEDKFKIEDVPETQIGFAIDGKLQPGRRFKLVTLSGGTKDLATNADGLFDIGSYKAGTQVHVMDSDSGKPFNFAVAKETPRQVFDVTQHTDICVVVKRNGFPAGGQPIRLEYYGQGYDLVANEDGIARQPAIYIPGATADAEADGVHASAYAAYPRTTLNIEITQQSEIAVAVCKDGQPAANMPVHIGYHGKAYDIETDGNGIAYQTVDYFPGETVTAEADGVDAEAGVSFPRTDISIDITTPEPGPTPGPESVQPVIRCVSSTGVPRPGYYVEVLCGDIVKEYIADSNGVITCDPVEDGTMITVCDGHTHDNAQDFSIATDASECDYVVEDTPEQPYNIRVFGEDGKPMAGRKVILRRGEASSVCSLDDNGAIQLDPAEYGPGQQVSIEPLSREGEYDRITVPLEAGEHDYEIHIERGVKKPWWRALVNAVCIILTVAAMVELGAILTEQVIPNSLTY